MRIEKTTNLTGWIKHVDIQEVAEKSDGSAPLPPGPPSPTQPQGHSQHIDTTGGVSGEVIRDTPRTAMPSAPATTPEAQEEEEGEDVTTDYENYDDDEEFNESLSDLENILDDPVSKQATFCFCPKANPRSSYLSTDTVSPFIALNLFIILDKDD